MNASDIMKYGQLTVLRTIRDFPEAAWETPGACGYWSAKDIIAHLASFEQVLVDLLTSFTGGEPSPLLQTYIETTGPFNDSQVNQRKDRSAQEVLAELNDAHARAMALLGKVPAETLSKPGTLPWYGMEYALDDLLVYMYYGHKREHSAQIAAFCDRLRK